MNGGEKPEMRDSGIVYDEITGECNPPTTIGNMTTRKQTSDFVDGGIEMDEDDNLDKYTDNTLTIDPTDNFQRHTNKHTISLSHNCENTRQNKDYGYVQFGPPLRTTCSERMAQDDGMDLDRGGFVNPTYECVPALTRARDSFNQIIAPGQTDGGMQKKHQFGGSTTRTIDADSRKRKYPYPIDERQVQGFPDFHQSKSHNHTSAMFDHRGGILKLNHSGVKVYIPPGAIPEGKEQPIFLYLAEEDRYRPSPTNSASNSTIVFCGPHGLIFQENVFVTIPHGAGYDRDEWKFQTLITPTDVHENPRYQSADHDVLAITDESITFMVDHFTGFGTKVEPKSEGAMNEVSDAEVVTQYVRFKPYIQRSGNAIKIRIRGLLPDYMEHCEQEEKQLRGKLADATKMLLLHGNHGDMKVNITNMSEGWTIMNGSGSQLMSHSKLQHSHDCATFVLQLCQPCDSQFSCCVHVKQMGVSESTDSVSFNISEPLGPDSEESGLDCNVLDAPLPAHIETKICQKLDEENPLGNGQDWRMFAEEENLSMSTIQHLQHQKQYGKSPTRAVLGGWIQRHEHIGQHELLNLVGIFRKIRRIDVAGLLDKHIRARYSVRRGDDTHGILSDTAGNISLTEVESSEQSEDVGPAEAFKDEERDQVPPPRQIERTSFNRKALRKKSVERTSKTVTHQDSRSRSIQSDAIACSEKKLPGAYDKLEYSDSCKVSSKDDINAEMDDVKRRSRRRRVSIDQLDGIKDPTGQQNIPDSGFFSVCSNTFDDDDSIPMLKSSDVIDD
ncbi:uncharacterized protein LOC144360019 [Saccoglossus kowalevskii]